MIFLTVQDIHSSGFYFTFLSNHISFEILCFRFDIHTIKVEL